jgi:uncharacterized membrane protein (DUF2068 family)
MHWAGTLATRPARPRIALRAVAVFEALKGLVVLLAATGLLSLIHQDLHDVAARLVEHAHLNPASRYPRIFIDAAAHWQNAHLALLALGAAAYSLVRFVEAYGLFHERAWAEVLAAVSGAIYVPFEVIEFVRRPSWIGSAVFALNVAIVAVMVTVLWQRRKSGPADSA